MIPPRRVFVLLPDHLDVAAWRAAWQAGRVPDETPYGYHHAAALGYEVVFSEPLVRRSGWAALPFKLVRRITGIDIEHAWNHRAKLFGSDVDAVWTHTEREFLPVALMARLLRKQLPPMVAQIVWLADEWPALPSMKRWLQADLLRDVAVSTCHSPRNLVFLQQRVGADRARLVEFGIAPELWVAEPGPQRGRLDGRPLRVLTLGNDRHRDWATFAEAFASVDGYEVFVASVTYPDEGLAPNVVRARCDLAEIRARYAWADVVVLPLLPNLHASGLTVLLEAVAAGKPVVASDVGGLDHYVPRDAVAFVPAGDAMALRRAVKAIGDESPEQMAERVAHAREAFTRGELDTPGYAARHVHLTERLLA